MGFDLHTHSVFSDGTTTPAQIVQEVARLDLTGFALTDHDTTQGWDEGRAVADAAGVEFLPGIELTTMHHRKSLHLLAYGPDREHPKLQESLQLLRDSRHTRAKEMIRRLRRDFEYDWDRLLAQDSTAGQRSIGRPHLADALVEAGYASDRSAAFTTILAPSGPYYLPTHTPSTAEAIALVHESGGVSVLAHPAAFRMRTPVPADMLIRLHELGLSGVEIYHPENRGDWIAPLHAKALELGMFITGSSDFHGAGKPNRLGEHTTPTTIVELIRERVHTPA